MTTKARITFHVAVDLPYEADHIRLMIEKQSAWWLLQHSPSFSPTITWTISKPKKQKEPTQ